MKSIAVIGLGNRGTEYMRFVKHFHSKRAKITALVDIRKQALKDFAPVYGISEDMLFSSADDFFAKGKIADAVFITTQDKSHYAIAKRALEVGYHILLEKPVSDSIEECEELNRLSQEKNLYVMVCHVLRYNNYYTKIKRLLDSGVLGKIISVNHTENIGYYHFAHSYVRGNWHKKGESTPSILAKCCHDLDLLSWFVDSPAVSVYSVGGLNYFKKENAPEGATQYCMGGCKAKENCPYDAESLYLTDPIWKARFIKFMPRTLTGKRKTEKGDKRKAVESGPYGRCVFLNDNDANDFQTVTISFESGATATMNMSAFSEKMFRESHIICEKGELIGKGEKLIMNVFGKRPKKIRTGALSLPGHVEGDLFIVRSFIDLLEDKAIDKSNITFIDATIESHRIAMAAEKSANTGEVVKLK